MESESIGQRVRSRREAEGWSQERLANAVGISRNYLSQIERGVARNLSWQVATRLSTALGLGLNGVEKQPNRGDLPAGLAEFAERADLPPEDVEMLARTQFRGRQPKTFAEWELLYKAIRIALGEM